MCRLFIRNKFKTRLNYALYYCWKFNEIWNLPKNESKKTCACTWCALFSEQGVGKFNWKLYDGGGGNYKVKKERLFVSLYFFSYMLRVNNNKSVS